MKANDSTLVPIWAIRHYDRPVMVRRQWAYYPLPVFTILVSGIRSTVEPQMRDIVKDTAIVYAVDVP